MADADASLIDLAPFQYRSRTSLVFGLDSVDRVGDLVREIGAQRILLVTDRGIVSAGHAGRVQRLLESTGAPVACFDQVEENPATQCVERCLQTARAAKIDAIVGLGGGSSMDTAKGCNFLLTNGGQMADYWGVGKATKPMLPLIAIPTTAGTGSECQSFALITQEQTHQKMACGDPKAAARFAILDPRLTLTQPVKVTTYTGIDALAHAVETAVTKARNQISTTFSHQGFRLAMGSFLQVLENPNDLGARGRMLLAAAMGGMAIENSMLGAAHSAANPLTAHFGLIHGLAVGMMLPAVVRFNAQDPGAKLAYRELAAASDIARVSNGVDSAVEALVVRLESLLNVAGLPRSLADCGVPFSAIPDLAREAAQQWTARFNPRPLTIADFEQIYTAAFEPRVILP